MGLDNSILIKRTTASPKALATFDQGWTKQYNYDLEVAYWRKCWNVRSIILSTINACTSNNSEFALNREILGRIIKELSRFNQINYEDRGYTDWDWRDFRKFHRRNLRALKKLYTMMGKDEDMKIYFYDSY